MRAFVKANFLPLRLADSEPFIPSMLFENTMGPAPRRTKTGVEPSASAVKQRLSSPSQAKSLTDTSVFPVQLLGFPFHAPLGSVSTTISCHRSASKPARF